MNVASLELCKELYELSGWKSHSRDFLDIWVDQVWAAHPAIGVPQLIHTANLEKPNKLIAPAYDLGYLLRKLPGVELHDVINLWQAEVDGIRQVADTPEDCAAKLAIELFKQGVVHA